MRADPSGIGIVHNSLRSGTNGQSFRQFAFPALSYPGHFRRKPGHMLFFLGKQGFRNKQGEISILHPVCFNQGTKILLHCLPDMIGCWAQDITAGYQAIFNQFCFLEKLGEPGGEIIFFSGGKAFKVLTLV